MTATNHGPVAARRDHPRTPGVGIRNSGKSAIFSTTKLYFAPAFTMMRTALATDACSIQLHPEAALRGPTASSALVRTGRLGGRLAGGMGFRRTPLCTGPRYPSRRCGFCSWRSSARPYRGARTGTPIAPARPSVGAIAAAAVLHRLAA